MTSFAVNMRISGGRNDAYEMRKDALVYKAETSQAHVAACV
jgi:hypothetical protein